MRFTLGGRSYTLTKAEVEESVEGRNPPRGRRYFVRIGRKLWPIKDALGLAVGDAPANFYTNEAYSTLQDLGFTIVDADPAGPTDSR